MDISLGRKKSSGMKTSLSLESLWRSCIAYLRDVLLLQHKRVEYVIIITCFLVATILVVRLLFIQPKVDENTLNNDNKRKLQTDVLSDDLDLIYKQQLEHDDELDLPSQVLSNL